MNKKLYILPGWGHKISDEPYQYLIKIAKEKGYFFHPIKWETRNEKYSLGSTEGYQEIIKSIRGQIPKSSPSDTILGFSIGAFLAYEIACQINFEKIILCSITPSFKKDLLSLPRSEFSDLTDEQYNSIITSSDNIIQNGETHFFCGDKEGEYTIGRISEIAHLNKAPFHLIENQEHDFNNAYIEHVLTLL